MIRKDIKEAITKLYQQAITNILETIGNIEGLSKGIKRYTEEPSGNFRSKTHNRQKKARLRGSRL